MLLDWTKHRTTTRPKPCIDCHDPSFMLDADGRPRHKVCAERATGEHGYRPAPEQDEPTWPVCIVLTCGRPADVLLRGDYSRSVPACNGHRDTISSGMRISRPTTYDVTVLVVTAFTWAKVRERLIADGSMTERGTTRRARATRCRRCGAETLIGFDADLMALEVEVDPYPLTAAGEVVALMQGRRTVALVSRSGRWQLNYRDAGRIARHAPGTAGEDVYSEHRCGEQPCGPSQPSSWERIVVDYTGPAPY